MSDQQNVTVVSLIGFAIGLFTGATLALFLAPMSGRDLRSRVHDEAQADWQRATEQYSQVRAEMRQQLESMRQQMEVYDQRVRDQLSAQMNQLQAKLEKQADS